MYNLQRSCPGNNLQHLQKYDTQQLFSMLQLISQKYKCGICVLLLRVYETQKYEAKEQRKNFAGSFFEDPWMYV